MAKVSFTKLGLKVNQEVKMIEFNEQTIEVKQYLPVNDKLALISNVINASADDYNFANPVKIEVFLALEIIANYTNINFTEKQREDSAKLYDLVCSSGLLNEVIRVIPEDEYEELYDGVHMSIEAIYSYQNSVLGILNTISQDYNNFNLDASEIQKKLADPENMTLLKDILTKLG